ncbi:MAG: YigZ family protein [Paludibacteraceae bacterium]|nr:YigZ family protein [Paludibacteraceae bacterium]
MNLAKPMQDDSYNSIAQLSEGMYKEKGSKFLSFAIPVTSVEEAKDILKDYRKKYYDARHICYAYVIGEQQQFVRSSDDGEPNGTAGKPILAQVNAKQLSDILLIVVRYFGGILLGTGGLVVAYREAAVDAIHQAEIIAKIVERTISFHCDYAVLNEAMKIIKEYDLRVISQQLELTCSLKISVRDSLFLVIKEKLEIIEGLTCQ